MSYAKHISAKSTIQIKPIFNRKNKMEQMASGGYAFKIDSLARLRRFLILGSDGGSYYVNERDLTIQNAKSVNEAFSTYGVKAIDVILLVSQQGLAPKNKPALFALAMAFAYNGNENQKEVRAAAKTALRFVARTGSDLVYFVSQVNELRGWGRGLRSAIAAWFQEMPVEKLAYQAVKYKQRDGWALRDLLRLSHPKTSDEKRNAVYQYIVKGTGRENSSETIIEAVLAMNKNWDADPYRPDILAEIERHNVPREALPTQWLNDKSIWKSLLKNMPLHAMLRNLGKMTSIGVLSPFGDESKLITEKLTSDDYIQKSRLHPFTILMALKQYSQGKGDKGSLSWTVLSPLVDYLEDAFFHSFKNVKPTGKNILVALDVSGSMSSCMVDGMSGITASQGAGLLGLVIANTEENYHIVGFDTVIRKNLPNLSKKTSVNSVLNEWRHVNGGGTDCAVPIQYALNGEIKADAIVIITDEESWFGKNHLTQSFEQYKKKVNKDAKLVIISTSASNTSIADPKDSQQLNISGFDASAFEVMNSFIRGDI